MRATKQQIKFEHVEQLLPSGDFSKTPNGFAKTFWLTRTAATKSNNWKRAQGIGARYVETGNLLQKELLHAGINRTFVDAVRLHAAANYNTDGWDYVRETLEAQDILDIIGDAQSEREAIERVASSCKVWNDRRQDGGY